MLLIPLIAMQFTHEVKWSFFDFAVAAALLISAAVGLELMLRKVKTFRSRLIWAAVILILLVLIWAELAVGIFGTPFAGN